MTTNVENELPDLVVASVTDITSIVNVLDKIKFSENVSEYSKTVEDISNWLNIEHKSDMSKLSVHEMIYFYLKIKESREQIERVQHSLLQNLKDVKKPAMCNSCGMFLKFDSNESLLEILREHQHSNGVFDLTAVKEVNSEFLIPANENESTGRNETLLDNVPLQNGREVSENCEEDLNLQCNSYSTNTVIFIPVKDDTNNDGKLNSLSVSNKKPLQNLCLSDTRASSSEDKLTTNHKFKFQLTYDKAVENALYAGVLMKHCVEIDNTKYPIFRMYKDCIMCMICKNHPKVLSISVHMKLEKHQARCTSESVLWKLRKFHNFWMSQCPKIQTEQKYFKVRGSQWKCCLCDVFVFYERIIEHIESALHRYFVINPLKRDKSEEDEEFGSDNASLRTSDLEYTPRSSPEPTENVGTNERRTHLMRKSVPDPKAQYILERIPQRFMDHFRLLEVNSAASEPYVSCTACSKSLKYDPFDIKRHIWSRDHFSNIRLPKSKFKFLCEICVKRCSAESSWEFHLRDKDHLSKLKGLNEETRDNTTEYECVTCSLVIFGDNSCLVRHKIWKKVVKMERRMKLPVTVRDLFKSDHHIEELAKCLSQEANTVAEEQEKEGECCRDLVKALKRSFPVSRAYVFGSKMSGLGNNDSDLDVFIDIGNMYNGEFLQNSEDQSCIIKMVAKMFRTSESFSHVNEVPLARTPIVKVFHNTTRIECDVSFKHGLSIENTKFIRLCIDIQPITQRLILLLKKWSSLCSLSLITHGLTSYALTMMVIFFLQTQGYLLSVKKLREINSEPPKIVGGWETMTYSVPLKTMQKHVFHCEHTIKELLRKFFAYYLTFDYENEIICPLLGHPILKTALNHRCERSLPKAMHSYIRKLQVCRDAEYFRNSAPLCVQDPFDLSHNLTKACDSRFVIKLQAFCDLSERYLNVYSLNRHTD